MRQRRRSSILCILLLCNANAASRYGGVTCTQMAANRCLLTLADRGEVQVLVVAGSENGEVVLWDANDTSGVPLVTCRDAHKGAAVAVSASAIPSSPSAARAFVVTGALEPDTRALVWRLV